MRTSYETLNDLEANGELKNLIYCGIVPVNTIRHLDIYRSIDARMKTGSRKTDAVLAVSVEMKVCRTTVFKILRTLSHKK